MQSRIYSSRAFSMNSWSAISRHLESTCSILWFIRFTLITNYNKYDNDFMVFVKNVYCDMIRLWEQILLSLPLFCIECTLSICFISLHSTRKDSVKSANWLSMHVFSFVQRTHGGSSTSSCANRATYILRTGTELWIKQRYTMIHIFMTDPFFDFFYCKSNCPVQMLKHFTKVHMFLYHRRNTIVCW